jgi:2,4-dienoyl-CoA reductase-like NADH-dependent reductase (Old Yellow Enzyme family)
MSLLQNPLTLPCGAEIPNRLAKAAMTEGLATANGMPTAALERLYGLWSDGGAGMLLSGNIQVDRQHLERPGNVIVDRQPDAAMKAALASWAQAATRNGNHFWGQISHAGRQTQKIINPNPKAPSAIKLRLPGGQFGEPVALTAAEIDDIVQRFGICAGALKEAGFTGVQVHAAHGYLLSQFLSPRSNQRDDQYGGSLANRARVLLQCVAAVRSAVGAEFPVAVKLNSADFQKGGFAFEECLQVVQWLQDAGVDLIEISGGTYEQPKLLGMAGLEEEEPQHIPPSALSTQIREAYFVDFALAIRAKIAIPLMVTGGFRQRAAMLQALHSEGADLIGLGRPMCVLTDAPAQVINGLEALPRYEDSLSLFPRWLNWLTKINAFKAMAGFAIQYWYFAQIDAIGRSGKADPELTVFAATRQTMKQAFQLAKELKRRA